MAEEVKKTKRASSALARLAPNAIKTNVDGQEIVVASSKDENDVLNMVVAAQMRNLLQENIKKYKEQGATLTPKELKELAEAARNVAEFSSEIYRDSTPLCDKPTEKPAEKGGDAPASLDDIKFDSITKPIEVKAEEKK